MSTGLSTVLTTAPGCDVQRCHHTAAVTIRLTHSLFASPQRANICARHEMAFVIDAEAGGLTVTIDPID